MAATATGIVTAGSKLQASSPAAACVWLPNAIGWLIRSLCWWAAGLAADRGHFRGGASRRLARGAQRLHEGDEGVHLGRRQILAVGGHVPATLEHLSHELVGGEPRRHAVEGGTALAAFSAQAVAVAALLVLDHERALELERRPPAKVLQGRRRSAPRLHLRRPRDEDAEAGQSGDDEHDQDHGEHGHGPALPALLPRARDEG